jgi:hypothetical protein
MQLAVVALEQLTQFMPQVVMVVQVVVLVLNLHRH